MRQGRYLDRERVSKREKERYSKMLESSYYLVVVLLKMWYNIYI